MKTVNRICQVLAVAFGLTALIMFFLKFATIVSSGKPIDLIGAELAFGGKISVGGTEYDMAVSMDILFCFLTTAIGFIMSIFSFKSKKVRYAVPAFGIVAAVYMLVISLSSGFKFVDARPISTLTSVTEITYAPFVYVCTALLFLFAAASLAYLLIDDYIEVSASKDKYTIPQRIVRFFRDYKSECKKIVWPTFRDVVKNTLIVLAICLIVGAVIWIFDKGIGELLKLILVRK